VHRDIKLENVMIQCKHPLRVKLIDFGFAERIDRKRLNSGQGTAGYIAPEIFKIQPYTEKSDVFSLGVMFFSLITGYSPFKAETYEGNPLA
jgi:serine/threonine protein kinase